MTAPQPLCNWFLGGCLRTPSGIKQGLLARCSSLQDACKQANLLLASPDCLDVKVCSLTGLKKGAPR